MRVIWQSEVDPYASRVLAKHWPTVPNLGDVTAIDWSEVERPDLICGGYPCQPFSYAGARRGRQDHRHLWPYFADALRVLRPRYALLENVAGHLSLGFGDVLGDLAELGFDAEWRVLSAAGVGAPHLRRRVFVVAHAHGHGESGGPLNALEGPWVVVGDTGSAPQDTHTSASGSRRAARESARWAPEPDVGRVADGVPAQLDRLRCLGNAVVPQVAEHVGRLIVAVEQRSAA